MVIAIFRNITNRRALLQEKEASTDSKCSLFIENNHNNNKQQQQNKNKLTTKRKKRKETGTPSISDRAHIEIFYRCRKIIYRFYPVYGAMWCSS